MRYRVEHKKIKFISISEYAIFWLYKRQWNTKSACFQRLNLLCNHNASDLFTCEDNSHVTFACEDMKFSRESSLGTYFTGIYIINIVYFYTCLVCIFTLLPGKQQAAMRTKGKITTMTNNTHNHGLSLVASIKLLTIPPCNKTKTEMLVNLTFP